jgi:SAM-dependent methyltransferase
MDWRVKAVVQGVLSRCAGGERINDLLQRVTGERRDPERHVASKVHDDWLVHAAHLGELRFPLDGVEMLEVGTGWLPVMPLCFALAGVRRCHTLDLRRHLAEGAARLALRHLRPHLDPIAAAVGADAARVRERWARWAALRDDASLLRAAGVEYLAPADASRCELPDASVDLVFSNSVLEHVPAETLDPLMSETRRLLAPGGLALHSVNCGDHYAYFDRRITPIHYLRYSARAWRWWNNDLLFQNRLRPVDFVEAARRAGLDVALVRHRPRPELLARLGELPIAEEFRRYPPEQLCSTSVDFAVRAPPPAAAARRTRPPRGGPAGGEVERGP